MVLPGAAHRAHSGPPLHFSGETRWHRCGTLYTYDGFDRPYRTTFPDSTYTQNTTVDDDGNVQTLSTRAGETIDMTYDRNERMVTKTVPASGSIPANTIAWTYDLLSQVTSVSDTNGNALVNTYDILGRQLTAAQTLPGLTGAKTVSYAYDDGAGDRVNRSKMTWPDGYAVTYGYDAVNHQTMVKDSDLATLAVRTYDNLSRPAVLQYPNTQDNVATSWSPQDELLTLTNTMAAESVAFVNGFTPAHQIKGATINNTAYRYGAPSTGTDTYGAANTLNQYTSVTPAGGSAQALTYDTRGNLTSDGTLTLTYDPENRLMFASKSGMSASYLYDPLGRRTSKTVNGTSTFFVHDTASPNGYAGASADSEIAEYGDSGSLVRRFVPGTEIDRPIAMVTCTGSGCTGANAVKTMFHTDKLGSVIAMTASTTGARVAGPMVYDPYGNCFVTGTPCSTAGTPFLYTGQRFDPETGLYYYKARCYSPSLGRFCQTDPVGYKDNYNLYAYVGDNPTNMTDPMGLWHCGQSKNSCTETKKDLKLLQSLKGSSKLSRFQSDKLDKILKFYGDFTADDDAVKVDEFNGSGTGRTNTEKGNTTVSIGVGGSSLATAGVLAHEGQHGVDNMARGGRNPDNWKQSWDTEMRAYTVESWINKVTNYSSPQSAWNPKLEPYMEDNLIVNRALGSFNYSWPGYSVRDDVDEYMNGNGYHVHW